MMMFKGKISSIDLKTDMKSKISVEFEMSKYCYVFKDDNHQLYIFALSPTLAQEEIPPIQEEPMY